MAITLASLSGQPQGQVAVPDLGKGKKVKIKVEREDREGHEDRALTAAHAADRAFMEAARAEHAQDAGDGVTALDARKAYQDRGITAGPGTGAEPGTIAPEQFDRPYLDAGHAARSPQAGPPRTPPLRPGEREPCARSRCRQGQSPAATPGLPWPAWQPTAQAPPPSPRPAARQ